MNCDEEARLNIALGVVAVLQWGMQRHSRPFSSNVSILILPSDSWRGTFLKGIAYAGDYAERISNLAVGGVYLLAGVPETVELCLSVAGGLVDTHVLMTLAALGLLALGQASEVSRACLTSLHPPLLSLPDSKGNTNMLMCCASDESLTFTTDWGSKMLVKLLMCYCMGARKLYSILLIAVSISWN